MTILETTKIDMVAARPDSDVVKLVMTDHLSWEDVEAHCRLIQEKVNTYLAFVDSGQLHRLENPPIPAKPKLRFLVVMQHQPPKSAEVFLERVAEFLRGEDIVLEIEIR